MRANPDPQTPFLSRWIYSYSRPVCTCARKALYFAIYPPHLAAGGAAGEEPLYDEEEEVQDVPPEAQVRGQPTTPPFSPHTTRWPALGDAKFLL